MSTVLKPLHNYILVRRIEAETAKGGIFIPTAAQELPTEGIIEAVGPGKVLDNGVTVKTTLKVGQRVLFGRYSGQTVERDGEKLLLLQETEVLAVIEKSKEAIH